MARRSPGLTPQLRAQYSPAVQQVLRRCAEQPAGGAQVVAVLKVSAYSAADLPGLVDQADARLQDQGLAVERLAGARP